jgi:ribosomal-protein-alanine N-acetyltransferase
VSEIDIRPITAEQTRIVRHPVLRAGFPVETTILDHDDDPTTLHLGAFDGEHLVGVATFFPEPYPNDPKQPAWRLRGMATLPDMQRRGIGKALMLRGIDAAAKAGARLMWFNARTTALPFYRSLGFVAVGEEVVHPMSGPHYVMFKQLPELA